MTRRVDMRVVAAMMATAALAGCGGEGGASLPAPVLPGSAEAGADAGAEASPPDAATAAPDAGKAVKRTVGWRDPFGHYAAKDNLVLDGDFEWVSAFEPQYPWFRDTAIGAASTPDFVVGMSCRSGMRCARIAPKTGIAGFATLPPAHADHADLSVWIKPASASPCGIVSISTSSCVVSTPQSFPLDTGATTPDSDGWCHFAGTVQLPDDTPCVFVSVHDLAPSAVLVDDVVMTPTASAASQKRSAIEASQEHMRVVERLRAVMRERLKPGRPSGPVLPGSLRGKLR